MDTLKIVSILAFLKECLEESKIESELGNNLNAHINSIENSLEKAVESEDYVSINPEPYLNLGMALFEAYKQNKLGKPRILDYSMGLLEEILIIINHKNPYEIIFNNLASDDKEILPATFFYLSKTHLEKATLEYKSKIASEPDSTLLSKKSKEMAAKIEEAFRQGRHQHTTEANYHLTSAEYQEQIVRRYFGKEAERHYEKIKNLRERVNNTH